MLVGGTETRTSLRGDLTQMRLASKLQSFEIQLFVVLLETSFFLWED